MARVLMIKNILSSGSEDKDLELDRPTGSGSYFALELLQATLLAQTSQPESPLPVTKPAS